MKVSLNAKTSVRLSAAGARVYNEYMDQFRPLVDTPRMSAGETLSTELWHLAHVFGPVMFNGNPQVPFLHNELEVLS